MYEAAPAWVAALSAAQQTSQLFVVAAVGGTTATISMHQRDGSGQWRTILTTPGFIGQNGLGKEIEGDRKTPVGTFRFTRAFGNAPDPGCPIPYIQVDDGLYWSGDPREGMRYNEMVRIQDLPELDVSNSEHLIEYQVAYRYALSISYNEAGTPGRGSAIFLHCFGPKAPYTAGCVSIPEEKMKEVLCHVREDCMVVIDTLEALGDSL